MTSEPDLLFHEGKAAWRAGNLQQAADLFFEILETDDQYHLAWNALGVVYSQAGEFEEADTCFKNALFLTPDNPVYLQNRGKNNRKLKALWEMSEPLKPAAKISNLYIIAGIVIVILIIVISLFLLLKH
jgi:tetratricopeptide (TPR) repeat protein